MRSILLPMMLILAALSFKSMADENADTLIVRAMLDSNGFTNIRALGVCRLGTTGRVEELTFRPEYFPGRSEPFRFPLELAKLDQLKKVSIFSLDLSEIPAFLFRLPNLRTLSLSYNKITTLPDSIALMSKLEMLDIHNNPINNFPASIWGMSELTTIDAQECSITSIPDGNFWYPKWRTVNFSGNQLCHQTLPTVRWLNTFTAKGPFTWANNQICSTGVQMPKGPYLGSHSYGLGVTKDSLLHIVIDGYLGTSFNALAEWDGHRYPLVFKNPGHPLATSGRQNYLANLSGAGFGLGKQSLDISFAWPNGDSASVRAIFVIVTMPTFDLGWPLTYAPETGKVRIHATASDFEGKPCGISVSIVKIAKDGSVTSLQPRNASGPLDFDLDYKEIVGNTLVLHYQAKDQYGDISDTTLRFNAFAYHPPVPADAQVADFAPMQVGNQWLYAGKVKDPSLDETYQYLTRIAIKDTFTSRDTLFYKLVCWDSIYGRVSTRNPHLKEYTQTQTAFAYERGDRIAYRKESDRPAAFDRVIFSHSHILPIERLTRRSGGSESTFVFIDTFKKELDFGSEYSTWTVGQNVGALEFTREIKYPAFLTQLSETVQLEGHLVAFSSGPGAISGSLRPVKKSAFTSGTPKRILKGNGIRFQVSGNAYNGNGQAQP